MQLPMTEAEGRASEREGERSSACTFFDTPAALETLAAAFADPTFTRLYVEKSQGGYLLGIVYVKGLA